MFPVLLARQMSREIKAKYESALAGNFYDFVMVTHPHPRAMAGTCRQAGSTESTDSLTVCCTVIVLQVPSSHGSSSSSRPCRKTTGSSSSATHRRTRSTWRTLRARSRRTGQQRVVCTAQHSTAQHATPRHATPRHPTPRHATPRPAPPCRAVPCRAVPCRAVPCQVILNQFDVFPVASICSVLLCLRGGQVRRLEARVGVKVLSEDILDVSRTIRDIPTPFFENALSH